MLYHGIVSPGRGLEACIRSVALWRAEFTLTIRGPASAAYAQTLQTLVEETGLSGRIVLAPPVPMIDLVREAAEFDVGLFALPGHSLQNFHVLPNKFFEYTMAGLALCVSDLPEMSRLLHGYELGRLIADVTPQAVAAAINGFDRASIDRFKANAGKRRPRAQLGSSEAQQAFLSASSTGRLPLGEMTHGSVSRLSAEA